MTDSSRDKLANVIDRPRDNRGRFVQIQESATPSTGRDELREVGIGGVTIREAEHGTALIELITPGWGSSGYYSEGMLARDVGSCFPAGTHMYLDHPTETEAFERPERSVKDLAAELLESARFDPGAGTEGRGAAVARVRLFPDHREALIAKSKAIGVSIRARGGSEEGQADGRSGTIITSLDEGLSVDFVTKAGRGGRIADLLESAKSEIEEARNVAEWLESQIHASFTQVADDGFGNGYLTREERIALSSAIGDALNAFHDSVKANVPQLFTRDPADPADPGNPTDPAAAAAVAEAQRKEAEMSDELKRQVEQLSGRVQTLESDRDTAIEERDAERTKRERAEDALLQRDASKIVNEATVTVKDGDDEKEVSIFEGLPARAKDRVTKTVLGEKLPMTDEGKLSKELLQERARKAAKAESEYLAEGATQEHDESGRVKDLGAGKVHGGGDGDTTKRLEESFQSLGMGESAAKIAAGGR